MSTSDVGKKKKTRPARGDLCPPVTWAKKKKKKKKKTRPARGDLCLTQRRGQKKTRPTRGDLRLTQRRGQKTRPMWGRRDSMSPLLRDKQSPPTGLGGGAY